MSARSRRWSRSLTPRRLMRPLEWLHSVTEISLERLWDQGYRALVLDLDNTLVGYKLLEPAPEVAAWVRAAQARGFVLAIVSNNVRAWVSSVATTLGIVTYVHTALKPLPFGIVRAVKQLRARRSQTLMIGDQLFADVLAAKLLGISAILTDPIVSGEHHAMWLVRAAERFLLLGTQRNEEA
ncbi:MAG: YqeG family HAD IIIA-type phosphatase [Candidatus Eremiobacteraeota bacterium]|nr:YqeG family HAD IIIA-type phosphatase [Candidatus Eremiobacteraeota bacterium]